MALWVAKIAVAKAIYSIDIPFDYLVPAELVPTLQVGMRVLVSFGQGNRGSEGLVLAISETRTYTKTLKSIIAPLDEEPVLSPESVQLALWMREHYFASSYDCIRTMLPTGLFFALNDLVTLTCSFEEAILKSQSMTAAARLVEYLIDWEGSGDLKQIRMVFGTKDPNPAIRFLINEHIATLEHTAKRNVSDKADQVVSLAVSTEDALAQVTPQRTRSPIRYEVIDLLCQVGQATAKELAYYTGSTASTIKSLVKSGLVEVFSKEVLRTPKLDTAVKPAPKPVLNQEQEQVLEGLEALLPQCAAALLYGVTGSGKTQVYLALIHKLLAQGRTALVLIPEISLTPQFLRIFTAQFGDDIAILHSGLRIGERYDEWKRVKRGDAKVVLGTRSAVFAPLENIGVIIIDEEQEPSYKSDRAPRYHARDIAKFRCVKHNALLLLGSATPSLDSMYRAKAGIYHLFTLSTRFNQGDLPEVTIIDMKEELKRGNSSSLSRPLMQEIQQNMDKKQQTILFLNRRGSNRMVTCGECGHVPECPNCALRLTYHSANQRLMCHYCGHNYVLPSECPECENRFTFIGVGTQQVQEDLEYFFPNKPILRMDADTISAVHTHEHLLQKFQEENVPVLVGTQMVAKGLDFENVTLVGVVAGDGSLFLDDIWAGERTFSLITQVIGRAGRGGKKGRAMIQSYTPDHDVIRTAAKQDYDQFYENEITLRQLQNYPPFRDVFLIAASGHREFQVLEALQKIANGLRHGVNQIQEYVTILGPTPAPIPRINNRFRYRITLMGANTKSLRSLLAHLLTFAQKDRANKQVSIYIDHLL